MTLAVFVVVALVPSVARAAKHLVAPPEREEIKPVLEIGRAVGCSPYYGVAFTCLYELGERP